MTENDNRDRQNEDQLSSDKKKKEIVEDESDIIELSDIAVGRTPEDEMIVELTEEVIDEAMSGIAGAIGDTFKDGEKILDLSRANSETNVRFEDLEQAQEKDKGAIESGDITGPLAIEPEDVEEHISKELDEFFGTEEEVVIKDKPPAPSLEVKTPTQKVSIPESELVEAVEIVLKRLYGDTINKLLADAIEKAINNEINRIKEFLTTKAKK